MSFLKKAVSVSLAAVMALNLASASLFSASELTPNNVTAFVKQESAKGTAAYAKTKITVDGEKDAAYSQTEALSVDHVAEVSDQSLFNSNFKGTTYVLWDEEYLYLFTEVSDTNIVSEYKGSFEETKRNDRLTYYFDFANTQNPTYTYSNAPSARSMYFDVRVTDDQDYNFYIADGVSKFEYPEYSDDKTSEQYKAYKEFVDKTFDRAVKVIPGVGYNFEVKIKISNLKFNINGQTVRSDNKSGNSYGFDVYLHDRQPGKLDGRVSLCTFSKDSDNKSWDYPGYLGTLTLGAKPQDAPKNGWIYENGNWRYYAKGTLAKDKFLDKAGKTVYVNAKGNMVKDKIITKSGKKYYVNKSGVLQKTLTGKKRITVKGKYYIVNAKGVIQTSSVVTLNGKKYIASKSGALYTGNKVIAFKGKKYYVSKKGVVAKNTFKTYKKATYWFGKDGAAVKNKLKKFGSKYYYFDSSCKMIKNKTKTIKGKTYKFDKNGVGKIVK